MGTLQRANPHPGNQRHDNVTIRAGAQRPFGPPTQPRPFVATTGGIRNCTAWSQDHYNINSQHITDCQLPYLAGARCSSMNTPDTLHQNTHAHDHPKAPACTWLPGPPKNQRACCTHATGSSSSCTLPNRSHPTPCTHLICGARPTPQAYPATHQPPSAVPRAPSPQRSGTAPAQTLNPHLPFEPVKWHPQRLMPAHMQPPVLILAMPPRPLPPPARPAAARPARGVLLSPTACRT